jgi:hypothetical protein
MTKYVAYRERKDKFCDSLINLEYTIVHSTFQYPTFIVY